MADASAPSPAPNNVELPSTDQEPTANGTAAMDVEMKEEPITDVKATLNSYRSQVYTILTLSSLIL